MTVFVTEEPKLNNQLDDDKVLRDYLELVLPLEFKDEIFSDLNRFGQRAVEDILELGKKAEEEERANTK